MGAKWCRCAETVNDLLAAQGQELDLSLDFYRGHFEARATVATVKTAGSRRRAKKPPRMAATFCPFCGVRYPDAKEEGATTPTRLDEIEARARDAVEYHPGWFSIGAPPLNMLHDTTAAHIAGLDPQTVVELCRLARIGLTLIRQPLTTGRHAATPDIDYPYPCPACGAAGACSTLCPGDE
jgi:hypothetical protein